MWVYPTPYDFYQCLHLCKAAGHPVVEPPKVPTYPRGNHPGFRSKQEGPLNQPLEAGARDLCVVPLPPQNIGEPLPLIPGPSHIVKHRRLVIFGYVHYPTQLLEGFHRL